MEDVRSHAQFIDRGWPGGRKSVSFNFYFSMSSVFFCEFQFFREFGEIHEFGEIREFRKIHNFHHHSLGTGCTNCCWVVRKIVLCIADFA